MNEKEILRQELIEHIDTVISTKTLVPKEFLDYLDRFSLLDNDTLVFIQANAKENDFAIQAINIILKARGSSHNVNLVNVEPDSPN